ncbi:right-handed parallel beta-helix repeat-containing protein [Methanococcoides orientis]|uniref:right-handed parallel beta-helix repeat-containing protein n=1 Tax=Methanococcoides orientis TaxID=2822137 RepID=UPI001E31D962|nr:NosD domain-containing protein [Methanococcoides orientis]UGV41193.1 right-handed parallel beta-helix repeat-containing protein [Methanococcoides orientis]
MRFKISFVVFLLVLLMISGSVAAKEITVDDDVAADFISIQDAVNSSKSGDAIVVYSGSYVGNLYIDKEIKLISKASEYDAAFVYATNPDDPVIHINANNVTVCGFALLGIEEFEQAGIFLDEVSGNIIENNNVVTLKYGICMLNSSNNTIAGNTINPDNYKFYSSYGHNPADIGIKFYLSDNNILSNNVVNSNNDMGISFQISSNNTLDNNHISKNGVGIDLVSFSQGNIITNNSLSDNLKGIDSDDTAVNNIYNNEITFREQKEERSFNISISLIMLSAVFVLFIIRKMRGMVF